MLVSVSMRFLKQGRHRKAFGHAILNVQATETDRYTKIRVLEGKQFKGMSSF